MGFENCCKDRNANEVYSVYFCELFNFICIAPSVKILVEQCVYIRECTSIQVLRNQNFKYTLLGGLP